MGDLVLLSYWEHYILHKFKSKLESRYKVKMNMPEIKNSDSCASNEVVLVNIVGDNQNIIDVKKFVKRKMDSRKCRKKREHNSSVIILDSDSETDSDDSVLSENRMKRVKRNRPLAQVPVIIDLEASPDLVENYIDTVASDKDEPDKSVAVEENCIQLHSNSNQNVFCKTSPSTVVCDNNQSVIIEENFIPLSTNFNKTDICNTPLTPVYDNDKSIIIEENFIPINTNSYKTVSCKTSPSPVVCDIIEISSDEESAPVITPPKRLRPVVIDGSNVARAHGKPYNTYSCKGIKLCVEYFLKKGHTHVTAFVPMYRRHCKKGHVLTTDQELLEELEKTQNVVFTPSRRVDGKAYTCYDDRFIVELASVNGGVILSNDNYKDLLDVSPAFKETIEKRLLMFCFVGDMLMVPDDPLGSKGPTLDEFLSFPPSEN